MVGVGVVRSKGNANGAESYLGMAALCRLSMPFSTVYRSLVLIQRRVRRV